MDGDPRTDSPKADFCYRFVRRFSDTVEIVGFHGRLGDCCNLTCLLLVITCKTVS